MVSGSAEPKPYPALMDNDIRILLGLFPEKIGFTTPRAML